MRSDLGSPLDLGTLRLRLADGSLTPRRLLEDVHGRIEKYGDKAVWIHRLSEAQTAEQLAIAEARVREGLPQPLLGIPFAIKDNINLAGHPTTAGCAAFAYMAGESATVVSRLCGAGAIVVGKTNLDQFATGLVGTRSPYGACRNVYDERFISGGSSSGSAVAVAARLVSFALGTDTAGSGRVPAGFNNLVGLKPTRGLISAAGVVPACRSLDCVSIFANNCADARAVFEVAGGFDGTDPYSRTLEDIPRPRGVSPDGVRFGVPREPDLRFFGNTAAAAAYRTGVERMVELGAKAVTIDYTPFARAAGLLYDGPWVSERTWVVKELLERDPEAMLPVTRKIIERGQTIDAISAFDAQYKLAALRQEARGVWEQIDVLLLPTSGTIYTHAEVEKDPIGTNTNLGYYTNFVNLMDLCAVAAPNGFQPDGLPVGISLIGPAGMDLGLLELAEEFCQ